MAACYLWSHHLASFFCPAPWPDEGQFLWPAIAFQRSNTLFAPQLNPDVTIMWMPPGYMVWHGLLFKFTGFSFHLVRWLSAFYILGAAALFLRWVAAYGLRWLLLLLTGAFLLSKWFIFIGNIARMEALLLLLVVGSFLLLQKRQYYKSLILLSISPLIHPHGLYFCLGGGLYVLSRVMQHREERKRSTADLLLMLIPVVLWSGYLVYAGLHWREFRAHAPLPFGWTRQMLSPGGSIEKLLQPRHLIGVASLLGCMLYTWRRALPFNLLGVFALSAKMLVLTSAGEQYGVYDALFSLTASVFVLLVCSRVFRERRLPVGAYSALMGSVVVALLGAGYAADQLGFPTEDWGRASVFGCIPAADSAYITPQEERIIREFIASLRSTEPIRIQFYPESDALLFHDLDGERVRLMHPTLCECVDPNTKWTVYRAPADVHIVHLSANIPERLYEQMTVHVGIMSGVPVPESDLGRLPLLHRRNATERWHYFIRSEKVSRP